MSAKTRKGAGKAARKRDKIKGSLEVAGPVKKAKRLRGKGKVKRSLPKKKCCLSRPRCRRCPLRMLAEGTLPAGLAVRHRRVVPI